MKPEEQIIAISKACGWRIKQIKVSGMLDVLITPPKWPKDAMAYTGELPDYLKDLNACHEMETALEPYQWSEYTQALRRIVMRDCNKPECHTPDCNHVADFWFYHATAAQRSEAFLRTIGKWKETQ